MPLVVNSSVAVQLRLQGHSSANLKRLLEVIESSVIDSILALIVIIDLIGG